MDGDVLYVVDALGQLAAVPPSGFGINMAQRLFAGRGLYLSWAWPRFGKDGGVSGFDMNKMRDDLYAAGARKGLWKAVEKVRGLGAWAGRDGCLILHCGEYLSIDGELTRPGEIDGHFYPRRPAISLPWAEPVTHADNPAPALLDLLKTWNWRRPRIDPILFLGWIGEGFLGGALPWRPSIFVTGDKAVGKSSLQSVFKAVMGDEVLDDRHDAGRHLPGRRQRRAADRRRRARGRRGQSPRHRHRQAGAQRGFRRHHAARRAGP
jgi:hypothetical protein